MLEDDYLLQQQFSQYELMLAPSDQMTQVLTKFIEAKQKIKDYETILYEQ